MSAPRQTVPVIKGWCPGAYRPMASGDGLVVRVRPWMGEISTRQAQALCTVADNFGTGILELTSRANIQIRGVAEADYDAVIQALLVAGLLDQDPAMEGRRNLLMTPDWLAGDETQTLATALLERLPHLPDLPAKFGYAVDTGSAPWLADAPADIRLERADDGGLILVADGANAGLPVTAETAIVAIEDMVGWFIDTEGRAAGRMARHLRVTQLPAEWLKTPRRCQTPPLSCAGGALIGAPFGQIETQALRAMIEATGLQSVRILPNRTFLAVGAASHTPERFCAPDDLRLNVHACTGAPGCAQALGSTRAVAQQLAATLHNGEIVHVSGCTKGCAHPRAADRTYVATQTGFDLVTKGTPWDAPSARGLSPEAILKPTAPQDQTTPQG